MVESDLEGFRGFRGEEKGFRGFLSFHTLGAEGFPAPSRRGKNNSLVTF